MYLQVLPRVLEMRDDSTSTVRSDIVLEGMIVSWILHTNGSMASYRFFFFYRGHAQVYYVYGLEVTSLNC